MSHLVVSAASQRRNSILLFAVIAVVVMAFSMVMPILPSMLEGMGGSGRDVGLSAAAFSLMQFFFSPIWGKLSDSYGRKPIILIGLLGCALTLWLYGLCTQLWMFYLARAFSGALASATFPTAMAYIGDTTSEEDRGAGMGMVNAAMYSGMMVGPTLSGWLASVDLNLPFYAGSGLAALLLLAVWLILPESLSAKRHVRLAGLQELGGPNLGEMLNAMRGPSGYLFFLSFLIAFGLNCFWSIFGMYALLRFGFGPGPVGTIMAFIGVGSAIVQLFLVGPLAKHWGEARLIRLSLVFSAFGFVAMLLAGDFTSLLITATLFVMANSLARPLVTTLISKAATGGQGQAMGLNNSFMSLGQTVGPTWSGFALDFNQLLPFSSGAAIMLFSLVTTYKGFKTRVANSLV